jgi:hypothetical protein
MPVSPVLAARMLRPITDERLAQAYAVEEILEALLNDLYQDMRNGAAMQACNYGLVERLCPPRAVARVAGHGKRRRIVAVALPRIRDPEPITDARLKRAFASESLLDAMLDDLYKDAAAGAAVVARRFALVWRHRPSRAISLALQCATV